jgi:hypothetical protein
MMMMMIMMTEAVATALYSSHSFVVAVAAVVKSATVRTLTSSSPWSKKEKDVIDQKDFFVFWI